MIMDWRNACDAAWHAVAVAAAAECPMKTNSCPYNMVDIGTMDNPSTTPFDAVVAHQSFCALPCDRSATNP